MRTSYRVTYCWGQVKPQTSALWLWTCPYSAFLNHGSTCWSSRLSVSTATHSKLKASLESGTKRRHCLPSYVVRACATCFPDSTYSSYFPKFHLLILAKSLYYLFLETLITILNILHWIKYFIILYYLFFLLYPGGKTIIVLCPLLSSSLCDLTSYFKMLFLGYARE